MEAICYYLLKSSFLLLLFYGCYHLFLRKETLFHFNRLFLITGLILSATLPLFYITTTIVVPFTELQQTSAIIVNNTEISIKKLLTPYGLLITVYVIVTITLLTRLLIQLSQLKKIIKEGVYLKTSSTIHTLTKNNIEPFSFFNHIVYNQNKHTENDLIVILAHEEVHASQLHSLDVLLMEIFLTLQWFNPIAWLYRIAIKQNLEFLADTENQQIKINRKAYQYVLLKQAIGNQYLSIVNPFFNSLIKKRIIMINQQHSNKSKALKSIIIIPLLTLFLVSFNVKEIYTLSTQEQLINSANNIEAIINKNTTDEQLLKIKEDLAKEKFDFSYTTVRNESGEIKNISLHISGGNKNSGELSSTFNSASDNDTIEPTYILIDILENSISIGNAKANNKMSKIRKMKSDNNKQLIINTSPTEEHDIEISEEKASKFIFINNDQEPLYYINGKKSDSKTFKNLDESNIESMNVLKGTNAIKKYGKDALHGVIEIITKE